MSSNWPVYKISDIAYFRNSKRVPLKSLDRAKRQGKYPYYGASGIVDYIDDFIFDGTYLLISEDGENLRSRKTPIAFKVHGQFWVNNHAHILEEKEEGVLNYLEYYFSQLDLTPYITGAVQPKLNKANLDRIEIPVPPLEERRKINGTLNSLVEKVQKNTQINQTLEQMAQAIFKSWFVDFEPVRAKIAARKRWQATQPGNEAASPVCYAGELGDPAAGEDLETAMNLAAMQAISGKNREELARLQGEQPEQYAELRATAERFPSAMQGSELGEIPQGWEIGRLADLLMFNPRRSLKKGVLAPYLDMKNVPTSGHLAEEVVDREMGSGTKFINGDTLLARITPCLENGKTAFIDFLDDDQVGWGSTEYIVIRPIGDYPESLGYFIARDTSFRQHAIQSMTGTSGRQRANAKALGDLPWLIYPEKLVKTFDKMAGAYLKLAKRHGDESKSLGSIRDTLLPKLLSGELTLPATEKQEPELPKAANV